MKLIGQRWEYRIGNSIVHVDNAFSWSLWAQERMSVNDEVVHRSGRRMGFRQDFKEPWLTMLGEDELSVSLRSRMMGISCSATLGTEPVPVHTMFEATWSGARHDWPATDAWHARKSAYAID